MLNKGQTFLQRPWTTCVLGGMGELKIFPLTLTSRALVTKGEDICPDFFHHLGKKAVMG